MAHAWAMDELKTVDLDDKRLNDRLANPVRVPLGAQLPGVELRSGF